MLERFNRIARRYRPMGPVAAILAAAFLATSISVAPLPSSWEADFLLIPLVVGFIWALSANIFLTGFLSVPRKATREDKLLVRVKPTLRGIAYRGMAVVFLALTAVSLFLSLRMAGIWLSDHIGWYLT